MLPSWWMTLLANQLSLPAALDIPPPIVYTTAPGAWPPLVPDCTAAYLNSGVAATAPTPTVVRVEVPAAQAVSLRGCLSPEGGGNGPMWLAMGQGAAVRSARGTWRWAA